MNFLIVIFNILNFFIASISNIPVFVILNLSNTYQKYQNESYWIKIFYKKVKYSYFLYECIQLFVIETQFICMLFKLNFIKRR